MGGYDYKLGDMDSMVSDPETEKRKENGGKRSGA